MKIYGIILTFFAFGLMSATSSAEIYKWIDENGVVHYSDSPTQNIAEAPEPEEIPVADPLPANQPSPAAEIQDAEPNPDLNTLLNKIESESIASEKPSVELYVTSWCTYCEKAKRFFRSKGIEFEVYDIEKDPRAARRMMSMTSKRAVPFVVINGQGISGYSEQAYEVALQN